MAEQWQREWYREVGFSGVSVVLFNRNGFVLAEFAVKSRRGY
jgi:hypothetical protein